MKKSAAFRKGNKTDKDITNIDKRHLSEFFPKLINLLKNHRVEGVQRKLRQNVNFWSEQKEKCTNLQFRKHFDVDAASSVSYHHSHRLIQAFV